jgi:hypothetical protein
LSFIKDKRFFRDRIMDRDYVVERYRTRDGKVPFEEWVAR